jgi:hypothetical protein
MISAVADRDAVLHELGKRKSEFELRYGVTRLGIFGSVARGEMRDDSDVDVVVEMREPDLFFLVHIQETLEQDLKRSVDVIRYRPRMNKYLKARIDREALYV